MRKEEERKKHTIRRGVKRFQEEGEIISVKFQKP
jgi:hypothetical protein